MWWHGSLKNSWSIASKQPCPQNAKITIRNCLRYNLQFAANQQRPGRPSPDFLSMNFTLDCHVRLNNAVRESWAGLADINQGYISWYFRFLWFFRDFLPKILSEHNLAPSKWFNEEIEKIENITLLKKSCVFGYKNQKNQKIQVDFFDFYLIFMKKSWFFPTLVVRCWAPLLQT